VNGLIPILDHISKLKIEVDLQDVLKWFTFDNTCLMVLGFDPVSFSVEFTKWKCENAFQRDRNLLW
jgi:hypothetical protein